MFKHAALVIVALALPSAAAMADTMKFKVMMSGKDEVPPTSSAGTGTADVTVDTAAKTIGWTVTYDGLTGEPTAAHFHGPAEAGKNAGPIVDISGAIKQGQATLTDQQLADVQAGKVYLNIHTEKFPDGEIRGQVVK